MKRVIIESPFRPSDSAVAKARSWIGAELKHYSFGSILLIRGAGRNQPFLRALEEQHDDPYGPDADYKTARIIVRLRNTIYAEAALLDSYHRGEAPIASHLLGPRVLDDDDEPQRKMGMEAGWAWLEAAHQLSAYIDLGASSGMTSAFERWIAAGRLRDTLVLRSLGGASRAWYCNRVPQALWWLQ